MGDSEIPWTQILLTMAVLLAILIIIGVVWGPALLDSVDRMFG